MPSNRVYPKINCKNCGNSFTPNDAREVYCKKQCRIDYNNDKKKVTDEPFNIFKKAVKNNENVLEKARSQLLKIGGSKISMDILVLSGYDPEIYFENTIDLVSGKMIFWNIDHGLFPLDTDKPIFKILKR